MSILSRIPRLSALHYKSPFPRSIPYNACCRSSLGFVKKSEVFSRTVLTLSTEQSIRARTRMKAAGRGAIVDEEFVYGEEINLTVMKTSLFFPGDGFTAYDSKGELVFRVDSYSPDMRDMAELILMDQQGRCLLTVRRKRPSLHQRWEGFTGEKTEGQKPIFSVRRSSIIGRASASMTVEMYGGEGSGGDEYWIEGSFAQRICTIYDSAKGAVAEIRRKVDTSTSVVLDKDVWSLCVKPGFDVAFVMGLVLVLAQINGDEPADDDDDGAGED